MIYIKISIVLGITNNCMMSEFDLVCNKRDVNTSGKLKGCLCIISSVFIKDKTSDSA